MKQLALIRHAKSSWKHPELTDFDRPLNKRGRRDAPTMGERLATAGFRTDVMATSPAKRAFVTAQTIAEAIGYPLDRVVTIAEFYLADPDVLLQWVQTLDARTDSVTLFGHNPGFTVLANRLGDLAVDNMPTCSIAVFEFDIKDWRELDYGKGRVIFFDFPKNNATL